MTDRISKRTPRTKSVSRFLQQLLLLFLRCSWWPMRGIGEINDGVIAVAHKERPFSQLRCSVVDSVYLEAVHMVVIVWEFLQIVCKKPYNRTRRFVLGQGWPTFFWTLSDWTMSQRSRQEAPHVLHQKELGLHDLYVVEKLP